MPNVMEYWNPNWRMDTGQCGFCPDRSIMDQIFTLKQIFEKYWEYGKDLFACFVDLEKAYDQVLRHKLLSFAGVWTALMVSC